MHGRHSNGSNEPHLTQGLNLKDGKLKVGELITNYGTKKYLKSFKGDVEMDKLKISRDAKWDGFYGVITNLED